jgi:hypothetical protein
VQVTVKAGQVYPNGKPKIIRLGIMVGLILLHFGIIISLCRNSRRIQQAASK